MAAKRRDEKQEESSMTPDWGTGLPEGLLDMIVGRLHVNDWLSFSKVCKAWKNVVVSARTTRNPLHGCPWLVAKSTKCVAKLTFCSTTERKLWCRKLSYDFAGFFYGSFQDWLISMVYPLDTGLKYFISLLNPFTGQKIILPRLLDYSNKLVLSGSPGEDKCVYMLVCKSSSINIKLWSQGLETWFEISTQNNLIPAESIEDVVFWNGYFCILTDKYNVFLIDAVDALSTLEGETASGSGFERKLYYQLEMPPDALEKENKCVFNYLVEHSGEILLVLRFFHDNKPGIDARTRFFEIYRLDFDGKRWVKLVDLGDQILFLGKNSSTLFHARELGIEEGNCIYFTDDYKQFPSAQEWEADWHYPKEEEESGFDEWGSFSLKDGKFGNFCYPWGEYRVQPVWITAPLRLYLDEYWPDCHNL